jgi:hypothetical protein
MGHINKVVKSLKKSGKPIKKFKIKNLVTPLQLTRLGFLAIAEKFQNTRGDFH